VAEREAEFQAGQICRRCGYRHTKIEYETGYRDDGTGTLSCFGWARIKREELHEARHLAERRERERYCRQCGGSLRDGQVEGCAGAAGIPPSHTRRKILRGILVSQANTSETVSESRGKYAFLS
jgi:hypothetical protein